VEARRSADGAVGSPGSDERTSKLPRGLGVIAAGVSETGTEEQQNKSVKQSRQIHCFIFIGFRGSAIGPKTSKHYISVPSFDWRQVSSNPGERASNL
jgi:hypothetical protein